MGQILIRNLDEAVIERLKGKALERGTSLEHLARETLTEASNASDREAWIARSRALRAQTTPDPDWDSTAEIRRARDALAARWADDDASPAGS
ncbi:FitA-like ribbon-helix-helix domain-containing protein [Roseomonas sp. F4]